MRLLLTNKKYLRIIRPSLFYGFIFFHIKTDFQQRFLGVQFICSDIFPCSWPSGRTPRNRTCFYGAVRFSGLPLKSSGCFQRRGRAWNGENIKQRAFFFFFFSLRVWPLRRKSGRVFEKWTQGHGKIPSSLLKCFLSWRLSWEDEAVRLSRGRNSAQTSHLFLCLDSISSGAAFCNCSSFFFGTWLFIYLFIYLILL